MPREPRYALSFTSGTLLTAEAAVIAPIYLEERDWAVTRARVQEGNLLQGRVGRSRVRMIQAVNPRLQTLTDAELEIVAEGTSTERGHLMWVAACRRFAFIAEFAEEVLRERFLTFVDSITHDDYDSFYRKKAMWHEELDAVTAESYYKLRQVLFKMMVEAGLLTKQGQIEPVHFTSRVEDCLKLRAPSDVRFFPSRDVA